MTHRSRTGGPPKAHKPRPKPTKSSAKPAPAQKLHHFPPSALPAPLPHPLLTSPTDADILHLIHHALHHVVDAETFIPAVQRIKALLYAKRWLDVFGGEEEGLLEAYAGRWVPSRAMCFRELMVDLPEVRACLLRSDGCSGGDTGKERDQPLGDDEEQDELPELDEGDEDGVNSEGNEYEPAVQRGDAPAQLVGVAADPQRRGSGRPPAVPPFTHVVSLGGGAGSELLALAAVMRGAAVSPEARVRSRLKWTGVDIGAWAPVLDRFRDAIQDEWDLDMEVEYVRTDMLDEAWMCREASADRSGVGHSDNEQAAGRVRSADGHRGERPSTHTNGTAQRDHNDAASLPDTNGKAPELRQHPILDPPASPTSTSINSPPPVPACVSPTPHNRPTNPASTTLATLLPSATLLTLFFTLSELLAQSRPRTLRLLHSITAYTSPGTLFLVGDSASDIAEFEIGGGGRRWPLWMVLDVAMLGAGLAGQPERPGHRTAPRSGGCRIGNAEALTNDGGPGSARAGGGGEDKGHHERSSGRKDGADGARLRNTVRAWPGSGGQTVSFGDARSGGARRSGQKSGPTDSPGSGEEAREDEGGDDGTDTDTNTDTDTVDNADTRARARPCDHSHRLASDPPPPPASWELVASDDSRWFRLPSGVGAGWPVKLENTRYWFRLYRRV